MPRPTLRAGQLYTTLEELQADLDAWTREYDRERTNEGRWCFGKTPMQTLRNSLPLAKEKLLARERTLEPDHGSLVIQIRS